MLPANVLHQTSGLPDINSAIVPTRRTLLLASLLAGLPLAASGTAALARKLDPSETAITLPDQMKFVPWSGAPPRSGEVVTLYGGLDSPGLISC